MPLAGDAASGPIHVLRTAHVVRGRHHVDGVSCLRRYVTFQLTTAGAGINMCAFMVRRPQLCRVRCDKPLRHHHPPRPRARAATLITSGACDSDCSLSAVAAALLRLPSYCAQKRHVHSHAVLTRGVSHIKTAAARAAGVRPTAATAAAAAPPEPIPHQAKLSGWPHLQAGA